MRYYSTDASQTTVTHPNGVTATSTYEGSGRVTKITYSDGTPTVTNSYNPDGSTSTMTDFTGTTLYMSAGKGNLTTETRRPRRNPEVHMGWRRQPGDHHLSRRPYGHLRL